jgi:hypothetical protein
MRLLELPTIHKNTNINKNQNQKKKNEESTRNRKLSATTTEAHARVPIVPKYLLPGHCFGKNSKQKKEIVTTLLDPRHDVK